MQNYKKSALTSAVGETNATAVVCLSGVEFAYSFSHTVRMVANDDPADRLADAVKARRKELDMSQLDVWQAGGPSNTTLTKVENGHLETLERVTARRLDKGLQWEDGSARAVWNGGDPIPTRDPSPTQALAERVRASADLSPQAKEQILQVLAQDEARQRRARESGTA